MSGWVEQPTVERIEIGRLPVASQRIRVEANALDCHLVGLLLIGVVAVESQRVSREVRRVVIQLNE